MKEQTTAITISEGKIDYTFTAYHFKEDSGMYSWHIPEFKMYFSSKDEETGRKRARAMATAFFKFYDKQGTRLFFKEIKDLGFTSPSFDFTVSQLANGKIKQAKFKAPHPIVPAEYQNAEPINMQANYLSMAM